MADERGLVARNPRRVNPRNRKVKVTRRRPVYLDTAEKIVAVLEAASDLAARSTARTSGPRSSSRRSCSPACASARRARCAGVTSTLANGRLHIRDAKTAAGVRLVRLRARSARRAGRAQGVGRPVRSHDVVFPTSTGGPRDKDNARERVIRPVFERADELIG